MLFKDQSNLQSTLLTFSKILNFYTLSSKFNFVFYQENSVFYADDHSEIMDCYRSDSDTVPESDQEFTHRQKILTGIVAKSLQDKEPIYFENIQLCEFFNQNIDLDTS
jgi:hypothetical protein